jgi:hypothetical protein
MIGKGRKKKGEREKERDGREKRQKETNGSNTYAELIFTPTRKM